MLHLKSRFGVLFYSSLRRGGCIILRTASTLRRCNERVDIQVGGSGNVKLDISRPPVSSGSQGSVLVHLPPGPSISSTNASNASSKALPSLLSTLLPSTTLITINYRLSQPCISTSPKDNQLFRYPQPIHDASIAFAYILSEITPSLRGSPPTPIQSWQPEDKPNVSVFGSHIGAALATMLALTHPNDIHSVTVSDPLVDWVILDELLRISRDSSPWSARKRSPTTLSQAEDAEAISSAAKRLIDLRTKLFASPSAYFDPFASPTLFLRAPGRDTPRTHAEALGLLDDDNNVLREQGEEDDGWEAIGGKDEYWDGLNENMQGFSLTSHQKETEKELENPAAKDELPEDTMARDTDLDTLAEAMGADSFGSYNDDLLPQSSTSSSSTSSTALPSPSDSESSPSSTEPRQIKRRKVLRRWPPTGRPDDVLLPYFNVFVSATPSSTSPSTTESTPSVASSPGDGDEGMNSLLRMQGTELVELMRRACFYGREKGFGEERVSLSYLPRSMDLRGSAEAHHDYEEERMRKMVEWLKGRLEHS